MKLTYTEVFCVSENQTWFGSSHVLNEHTILQDAFPKTLRQYELINEARNASQQGRRFEKWPQYSEYTVRYQLHEQTPTVLGTPK